MQKNSRRPVHSGLRLPPPDPLSTVLLYIGAVVMALDTALAPGTTIAHSAPVLTLGGVWPFVPILLLSAAALVWIVRGLGVFDRQDLEP